MGGNQFGRENSILKLNFEEDDHFILVLPPAFFVERGFMEKNTYYQPQEAVYGLRRSPRLWGEHRDEAMKNFIIEVKEEGKDIEKFQLKPLESEPNLWKVVKMNDESEKTRGVSTTSSLQRKRS